MLDTQTIAITIPQETVNDETVRIIAWHTKSGSPVEKDQLICEVETSKAIMEIHAPASGIVTFNAAVGSEVPVGSRICEIAPPLTASASTTERPTQPITPANGDQPNSAAPRARATPLARSLASEHGIDLSTFPSGSLIRSADILQKAGKLPPNLDTPQPLRAPQQPSNPLAAGVSVEWEDLPRRKSVEARILGAGQSLSIQSSVAVVCHAQNLSARAQTLGLNLAGRAALIVFEVARLLRKYPMLNAIHQQGKVGKYQQVNIGWALDGGQGSVVPVLKNADAKTPQEIASLMENQIEAYLTNTLEPTSFAGATFTISDLSAEGITYFQPLISQGQSAILGVGEELTAQNPLSPLYLTLAFDHQVAEGRMAARFLNDLSTRLQAHANVLQQQSLAELLYCARCQRDEKTLREVRAILVRSEIPPGFVCSLCLGGY